MNDNEFSKVGLYEHNAKSYRKIKEAYESGEKIVGIVHATGTGKSYNALQLAYDNPDKKILWIVPNNSISEYIESIIRDNPNLDRERDFKNIEFRTYQSFINMSKQEISELNCDLLILDEFHHIGAPVWGARINTLVETHPEMLVFGMTAYTVIGRGTPYERDMADPDTNELFSNKIVSRYDLVDAMLDRVLPMDVIYRTGYTHLLGLEKQLEEKIDSMNISNKELYEYKKILESVKKRIAEAPTIETIMKKYIKPNGKYLYFCPTRAEDGTNDVESIMKEAYGWFKEFIPEDKIQFYKTTSEMKEEGKKNREAFYNDLTLDGQDASDNLRIMFAINQYNEGVHAPNVDGVIMGRGTKSDIIFFEQLGRALSVRGDIYKKYQEYESYNYDELLAIAKDKEIVIDDNMKNEDIIEKLISPLIIDLSNNIEFIKKLENNLKYRQKEKREKGNGTRDVSKLRDVSFDIDVVNEDLYDALSKLRNRVYRDWDSMYELAKSYYEHKDNLDIPNTYRTLNGYEEDENGVNLGQWIRNQRNFFNREELSQDKINKLKEIGMIFVIKNTWLRMYKLAKQYYDTYGNLDIPIDYEVKNIDGDSVNLYSFVKMQQESYINGKLSNDRKKKLELIGMKFAKSKKELSNEISDNQIENDEWTEMYKLAKAYYLRFHNLNVPLNYRTNNGHMYSPQGKFLGEFIASEKEKFVRGEMNKERKDKWEELDFSISAFMGDYNEMYSLAKSYFDVYRHLDIPIDFKTNDGISYDETGMLLGAWLKIQFLSYKNGKISTSKKKKLEEIGMIFDNSDEYWNSMYEVAKNYYKEHDNLPKIHFYISSDGHNLGAWLYHQKHLMGIGKLAEDKVSKLEELGIKGIKSGLGKEDFDMMCELASKYYLEYHISNIPIKFRTFDGCINDNDGYSLGLWFYIQIKLLKENKISKEKIEKLTKTKLFDGFIENIDDIDNDKNWYLMYELSKVYYKQHRNFDTLDSVNALYEYDIPNWIKEQKTLLDRGMLNDDKKTKLEELGIVGDLVERELKAMFNDVKEQGNSWNFMYNLAKIYHEHKGNLKISNNFRTFDGFNEEPRGWELGKWILLQKTEFKNGNLTNEQFIKLKEIKFEYTVEDVLWDNFYDSAKKHYDKFGNLDIDRDYKTINGTDVALDGVAVGEWIKQQQNLLKDGKLNAYRKYKLEELGIKLEDSKDNYFEKMYAQAKEFYDTYGHLDVRFKQLYNSHKKEKIDEEILELWVFTCKDRYRKGKLNARTIEKLSEIGIFLTAHEVKWNHMYKLACNYLKHWGNLYVPLNFNTKNGYEYADKGYELGRWIAYQRNKYSQGKLDQDRIDKLNSINMVWDIRNNKQDNIKVCLELGIDYKRFGKTLSHISNIELVAKINYLLSIGENIVYTHNYGAHEIFTMSSIDMKNKYGYTLEELINEYYIVDKKNRGI